MVADPNEWANLASMKQHDAVMEAHRKWIPSVNKKPVPLSRDRILLYDPQTGSVNWEGQEIAPNASIPEIDD